jgi:hypothetical protein
MVTMRIGSPTRSRTRLDLGRVRIPHQGRLVGTAPLRGQPGPFQMDPVEQGAANVVAPARRPDAAVQHVAAVTRDATSVVVPCLR